VVLFVAKLQVANKLATKILATYLTIVVKSQYSCKDFCLILWLTTKKIVTIDSGGEIANVVIVVLKFVC
jgi:hypothetical protein